MYTFLLDNECSLSGISSHICMLSGHFSPSAVLCACHDTDTGTKTGMETESFHIYCTAVIDWKWKYELKLSLINESEQTQYFQVFALAVMMSLLPAIVNATIFIPKIYMWLILPPTNVYKRGKVNVAEAQWTLFEIWA